MSGDQTILQITNLEAKYGNVKALSDVEMTVCRGDLVCVVGSNGAGKSTLMKTITGLLKASAGGIEFQGEKISNLPPYMIARKGISLVPEGRILFGDQSVLENLVLGGYWCRSATKEEIQDDIERSFERFPILKERRHQLASTLSGGEQQMLAISRSLMARPRLLLIDEPSIGLAPVIVSKVFETIADLRNEGITIVLVEQMARLALNIATTGYLIENGKIVLHGKPEDLLKDESIVASYLGKS